MNGQIEKMREFILQRKPAALRGAERQAAVWRGETPDSQPLLLSCPPDSGFGDVPDYNTKQTHFDTEKMLVSGFKSMLSAANGNRDAVPSLRANMGCGIFPTMFGLKQMLFDDKMPWLREHLDKKTVARMGPEDLKPGDEFKAAIEHMAKMKELVEDTGAFVFPLDLQSPFGTAHLVYGDALFYELYDDPPFVRHLLDLCCECLIFGMTECMKVMNGSDHTIAHYNNLVIPREKGGLKVSEDTATLVGQDALDEFVLPYLRRLLERFGGGYVHYCGKNDRLFNAVLNEPLVHGLNFGNADMHDMDDVLKKLAHAGKVYYGGVPSRPDETRADFFRRVLTASKKDGLFWLLLCVNAEDEHGRDDIIAAWESVLKEFQPA